MVEPNDELGEILRRVPGHALGLFNLRSVHEEGADVAYEVDLRPEIENSHGSLQGGLAATLADVVAGRAVVERLRPSGRRTATLDLHIRYLLPTRVGPVRAIAKIRRFGARIVVVEVEIIDVGANRELVATATLSFMVLEQGLNARQSAAAIPRQSDIVVDQSGPFEGPSTQA
jgi:uncharacterized protein (TIGR00369 family)